MIEYICDRCGEECGIPFEVKISYVKSGDQGEFHVCEKCVKEMVRSLMKVRPRCGTCRWWCLGEKGSLCGYASKGVGKPVDEYRDPCGAYERRYRNGE